MLLRAPKTGKSSSPEEARAVRSVIWESGSERREVRGAQMKAWFGDVGTLECTSSPATHSDVSQWAGSQSANSQRTTHFCSDTYADTSCQKLTWAHKEATNCHVSQACKPRTLEAADSAASSDLLLNLTNFPPSKLRLENPYNVSKSLQVFQRLSRGHTRR